MPRIDLAVPFEEKDEAKRLGARWDGKHKLWYVPDGVDAGAFGRWVPSDPYISIRSISYFIAKTTKKCWNCSEDTSVFGFILPGGYESLLPNEEDDMPETWYRHDGPHTVYHVSYLLPGVVERIKTFSRHYRVNFSKTMQSWYWMNHCERCGIKQGDFDMYCEPQGAFFPIDERAASQIVLHECAEPFGCNSCTISYDGDPLIQFMSLADETGVLEGKIRNIMIESGER